MRRVVITLGLAAALVATVVLALRLGGGGLTLRAYAADEVAAAASRGEPVMLLFTAEWCSVCRRLDDQVLDTAEVERAAGALTAMRVDVTRPGGPNVALQRRFGVDGLPTAVFLGRDGRERRDLRMVGYESAPAFARRLAAAAQ